MPDDFGVGIIFVRLKAYILYRDKISFKNLLNIFLNINLFFYYMEQVKTNDNSVTFYNEKYQEWYHSKTGAIEEAFEKYAKPSNLKDGMKILDICFGIGYNSAAALDSADNLTIFALENDPKIIDKIQDLNPNFKNYDIIKQVARDKEYNRDGTKIKLIIGDARITIKQIKERFDVVFLDPFSVRKCPHLWTAEFFSAVYNVMNKGGILTTYSCARVVRDNLKKAGFKVKDGPCIGRRSPSTIAIS